MVQEPVHPSWEGSPVILWEGSFLRRARLCLHSPASVHHVFPREVLPRGSCCSEGGDNQVRLNFPQPQRPVERMGKRDWSLSEPLFWKLLTLRRKESS